MLASLGASLPPSGKTWQLTNGLVDSRALTNGKSVTTGRRRPPHSTVGTRRGDPHTSVWGDVRLTCHTDLYGVPGAP
jgi:hypothetical protein